MSITRRLVKAEALLSSLDAKRQAPPTLDALQLFRSAVGSDPDPWQRDLLTTPARRVLLMASRQSGKSTVTAVMALHEVLYSPGSLTLCVSPSLRQSSELYRKVVVGLGKMGQDVSIEAQSALRLETKAGSRVISLPGSEATVRGYSRPDLILVDEAARVDPALIEGALRPMLATVPEARMILLSTPWGKAGTFYNYWMDGGPEWKRVMVTADQVSRISPAFLEQERRALPRHVYLSEYFCEFTDNELSVFSSEDIHAALDPTLEPLFPGHQWEG